MKFKKYLKYQSFERHPIEGVTFIMVEDYKKQPRWFSVNKIDVIMKENLVKCEALNFGELSATKILVYDEWSSPTKILVDSSKIISKQ